MNDIDTDGHLANAEAAHEDPDAALIDAALDAVRRVERSWCARHYLQMKGMQDDFEEIIRDAVRDATNGLLTMDDLADELPCNPMAEAIIACLPHYVARYERKGWKP